MTVIVNVGKQSAGSIVENTHSGCLGYVLEGPISTIPVKPVREACRLADVKLVKAVVIDVANGQSVVAVDVDAAGGVQDRSPVVGASKHLLGI